MTEVQKSWIAIRYSRLCKRGANTTAHMMSSTFLSCLEFLLRPIGFTGSLGKDSAQMNGDWCKQVMNSVRSGRKKWA